LAIALLLGTSCGIAAAAGTTLKIEGDGPATVVFEAGLGDTRDIWRQVQPRVADHCARTVAYTRAGYGFGHRAESPRDAEHIVEELRENLRAQNLSPPYVLVGHSLGGLYMQYYTRRYPGEVRGLLLVDSTHWEQLQRIQKDAPATYRVIKVSSLLMNPIMRREMADSRAAGAQVAALASPETVPAIVLSSTRAAMGETAEFRALQADLQHEIAAAYATRRQVFVPDSGHYIQRDQPQAVIGAARELAGCNTR
jgi:pimeloyl-ACP methyl ester carboxylesterase